MDPRLILTIASAAAELFAAYRLVAGRVHRLYPWFGAYLVLSASQSFIWLVGSPKSRAYATVWMVITPIMIFLQALVVNEAWRKLMGRYPGISTISRVLAIVLATAAISAGFFTGFDGLSFFFGFSRQGKITVVFWLARYSGFVLAACSAAMAFWAELFNFEVPRNLHRHLKMLAIYFGSVSLSFLAINFGWASAAQVGAIATGSSAGIYAIWGLLLSPAGQITEPVQESAQDATRVLSDLRTLARELSPF